MTAMSHRANTLTRASREIRDTYRALNDSARQAEKEKDWQEAGQLWSKAARFAIGPTEGRYCLRRAQFCTTQAKREVQHG